MGKYKDEVIIRKRREREKELFQSIEQGMYVGEQFLNFQPQCLNDEGLEMFLPDNMGLMEEDVKKLKYPMELRPPIIRSNADASVTFTFNHREQKAGENDLEHIRDNLGILILSVYPHFNFTDKGKVQHEKGACCWTEFLSPVVGGMLYSILYTASLDERLLIGMFNCPADYKNDWKRIVLQLLSTIRLEEGKK